MSMTTAFFDEICRRGGAADRPFVDANAIAVRLTQADVALCTQQRG